MMKVKIIAGVFGWNHGTYDLVKAGDPAIEVDEALAHRLVEEKGVAKYVTPPQTAATAPENDPPEDKNPEDDNAPIEYSVENKADYLRELGKKLGLNFRQNMSKAEMVEALDKHFEELENDPDAPTFDATKAVQ